MTAWHPTRTQKYIAQIYVIKETTAILMDKSFSIVCVISLLILLAYEVFVLLRVFFFGIMLNLVIFFLIGLFPVENLFQY